MTLPNSETVEYDIRLEATKALIALGELTNKTTSFKTQLDAARMSVKEFATQMNMSFGQAKNVLSGLDKELSGTETSSVIFGGKGQEAWNKFGDAAQNAGNKVKSGTSNAVMGINVLRVALYTLVVGGVFAVINAFQQLFSMAIKGLRELETATYNLVNAERNLSNIGVEITPQGLDETIAGLQKLSPLLSKIEASELVSRVAANVAPQVGFGAEEIKQLSESITILAIKNKGLGKSFEEVESQVTNAFLTGRVSQAINNLGVKITDQIVKDEALRLGLVKTADEFENLTGKVEAQIKARAMLSVISQVTDQEREQLPEYLKTADAQFGIFQARLQDLLTLIGKNFGPLLGQFFEMLAHALTVTIKVMEALEPIVQRVVATVVAALDAMRGGGFDLKEFSKSYKDTMESFAGLGGAADTPTGLVPDVSGQAEKEAKETEKWMDKLRDIMQDNIDKLQDMAIDYNRKLEDIARDSGRKMADLARDTAQKREDAQRDYGDKVADINRDYAESAQEARQEYQQNEEEQEREHQDRLKELREKYLVDLEEALRERDARQILRLMRQYQIDKNRAVQDRAKEKAQNRQQLAQKMQDLEIERQQKLAQAQRELAEKLRDIQIGYERERAEARRAAARARQDARIDYNRKLEDQRMYLQRKLRDLATAMGAELQMTAQGAQAIAQILNAYFGASGVVSGIFSGLNASIAGINYAGPSGAGTSSINNPAIATNIGSAGIGSGLYNPYDYRTRLRQGGLAEGGTFLATRPQSIDVAETRPEIITATPLGRPGMDVNKLFTDMAGTGGGGGSMEIGVTLSPDLEGRVVRKAMDETAKVVFRVNKTKV
jgi:hypothetical protein